ncbi:MAG TPA: hypothetical protein VLM76_06030 [Patescibacteria group bacterium]|nr:hypothetical protein [Patescibacteria group bacterium]
MIVVIGPAALRTTPAGVGEAVGAAPEIAAAAAADGSVVEIVTKIGEDGAGEELLLALGRSRVGHRAVLRDPARPTALAPDPGAELEDADLVPALLVAAEPAGGGAPAGAPPDSGPVPALEPADLALALRYLRDYRVIVAIDPTAAGGADLICEAASFADASLVVVAVPGVEASPAWAGATVLEAPVDDPDGAFAGLVGRFAAALDGGVHPEAFRAATAAGGWETADR